MKVIIFAGGLGTRISEETSLKPKPMVEIGGKPILWHLLRIYAAAGFNEFIIALGYKQEVIKEYFKALHTINNDLEIDVKSGEIKVNPRTPPPFTDNWKVTLVDTGIDTQTGGRLKRLQKLIGNETCMATYGDGLADIDINDLLIQHRIYHREATLTAVRPPARFGSLTLGSDSVLSFTEKPQASEGWINGGFFVLEPSIFERIEGDRTLFEHEPLTNLASDGQLTVYRHSGFWRPVDTLRDKVLLEEMWNSGKASWIPKDRRTR